MIIEAIAFLSIGLVMFFISLPLAYRKVPMNSLYGIRIPAAFESDQRWYDINAYGGRQLAAWSCLIIATGVIGFFIPDDDASIYTPLGTAIILLAILIPLIRVVQWSRRLPSDAATSKTLTVSGEIAQSSRAPTPRSFFKKRTLIPAVVLGFLCSGYLIFIAASASWLPAQVATHFGASGRANGWMHRESYLHFIAILGLALAFLIAALAFVMGILQSGLKPSRRVDKTSSKWNQNLSWLCGDMLWLACLILCFIAGIHYLTIIANHSHPAHLPTVPFAILVAGFGTGNIAWLILLCFHLTRKPDASSDSGT